MSKEKNKNFAKRHTLTKLTKLTKRASCIGNVEDAERMDDASI